MFSPNDILYEDNHLLVVNKRVGDLVQPDKTSDDALENYLKAFLKVRDHKPGDVFLGVVHRIDRPVGQYARLCGWRTYDPWLCLV